jgi:hypothetical protein
MLALLCAASLAGSSAASASHTRRVLFSRAADGSLAAGAAAAASGDGATTPQPLGQASGTSTLTITLPSGANPRRVLAHTDALFGIPAYQSGTSGLLYYPRDRDAATGRVSGCAPFTDTAIAKRIVLLDRSAPGDAATCYFTQKVANAQAMGAYGVVVVDALGLCSDPKDACATSPSAAATCAANCPWRQSAQCQCALPQMADTGGGSGVSIPSMLVSRSDGALLRAYASNNATLPLAAMRWDIPAADGSVMLVMWQDSIDQAASAFRDTWALYVPYLATSTRFTPHFYVRGGGGRRMCGCTPR